MKVTAGIIFALVIALIVASGAAMSRAKHIGILQSALDQRDQRLGELSAQLNQLAEQAVRFDQILEQREADLSAARGKSAQVREVIRVIRKDPDIDACMDMHLPDAVFDGVPIQSAAGTNSNRAGIPSGTPDARLSYAADTGADDRARYRALGSDTGSVAGLQRGQSRATPVAGAVEW